MGHFIQVFKGDSRFLRLEHYLLEELQLEVFYLYKLMRGLVSGIMLHCWCMLSLVCAVGNHFLTS